jgi:hypothetical protein
MKAAKRVRDPDETKDMRTLIAEVIPDHERWMETPHYLLGGHKPKDLIGITPARKFRKLRHTNPTRQRGECSETLAGASG